MSTGSKLQRLLGSSFTKHEIAILLRHTKRLSLVAQTVFIHAGDLSQEIFFILHGSVKISIQLEETTQPFTVATLGANSIVGELTFLTGQPRAATVSTLEATQLLVLDPLTARNYCDFTTWNKLLYQLNNELAKKLVNSNRKLVTTNKYLAGINTGNNQAAEDLMIPPTSILVLFGWNWHDMMYEAPFLAAHGYDAIKINTPQEIVIRPGNPWWTIYQPVSYFLNQLYGEETDFIKMIDFCHSYGLKIYVDLLLNHMAEFIDPVTQAGVENCGTNQHSFQKYHYSPLNADQDSYQFEDFYHFLKDGNQGIETSDYNSLDKTWNLEHHDLHHLPTLNLESIHVLAILRKYIIYLLSLGVDGFRIDAAKHIKPTTVKQLFSGLRTKDDRLPFIYQEYYIYIPAEIDSFSFMEKYFQLGYVTVFQYSRILADLFNNRANSFQTMIEYGFGSHWLQCPENRAVVVIDNHDTERDMPELLNYKSSKNNSYVLAYIFMLSWPFGIPKIMSSFHFQQHDDPIPNTPVWQNNRNCCFEPHSPWVAQHRWQAIANMVFFQRKTQEARDLAHIWVTGNQLAFARIKPKIGECECQIVIGFVVINATTNLLQHNLLTGLPAGSYHNLINSNLIEGAFHGPTIEVNADGTAIFEVPAFDAVVLLFGY